MFWGLSVGGHQLVCETWKLTKGFMLSCSWDGDGGCLRTQSFISLGVSFLRTVAYWCRLTRTNQYGWYRLISTSMSMVVNWHMIAWHSMLEVEWHLNDKSWSIMPWFTLPVRTYVPIDHSYNTYWHINTWYNGHTDRLVYTTYTGPLLDRYILPIPSGISRYGEPWIKQCKIIDKQSFFCSSALSSSILFSLFSFFLSTFSFLSFTRLSVYHYSLVAIHEF